ncbi:MAG: outer membrane protein assembly factor BamD, partial [Fidelibacterota bacterium]
MRRTLVSIGIILLLVTGCGKSPDTLMDLAREQTASGEYDLAIQSYDEVLNIHPDDSLAADALYAKARVFLDNKSDYEQGFTFLRQVTEQYPDSKIAGIAASEVAYFPDWLQNVAESYRNKNEIQKAIQALQYLVEHFPDSEKAPRAQYLIGDIYMNDLRDFTKAIGNYQQVIEQFAGSGQDAHAQFMIGYIYANILQDEDQARLAYQTFIDTYPTHELIPSVSFELEYLGMDI